LLHYESIRLSNILISDLESPKEPPNNVARFGRNRFLSRLSRSAGGGRQALWKEDTSTHYNAAGAPRLPSDTTKALPLEFGGNSRHIVSRAPAHANCFTCSQFVSFCRHANVAPNSHRHNLLRTTCQACAASRRDLSGAFALVQVDPWPCTSSGNCGVYLVGRADARRALGGCAVVELQFVRAGVSTKAVGFRWYRRLARSAGGRLCNLLSQRLCSLPPELL
jgi:hypothetical protein